MILPRQVRSGSHRNNPVRQLALRENRSSLHHDQQRAKFVAQRAQTWQELWSGGTQFILPATGSTIIQAISAGIAQTRRVQRPDRYKYRLSMFGEICRNARRVWLA